MMPALKMSCEELEALLQPYLDGEFDAEERVEVERHLDACVECSRHMQTEAAYRETMRRAARELAKDSRAPGSLRANLVANIALEDRRRRRTSLARLSAAALLLVTAGGSYLALRPAPERPWVEDAARWHSRQLPTEVSGDDLPGVERWFGGKLDHHVSVPRFENARVAGARLSLVKDRPAAHITYVAHPDSAGEKRVGLFVFADSDHDVEARPLPSVELAHSNGYNVALWREGEIVYQLVSDLEESDIRELLAARGSPSQKAPGEQRLEREAHPELLSVWPSQSIGEPLPVSMELPPASFAATLAPSFSERPFDVRPASMQH